MSKSHPNLTQSFSGTSIHSDILYQQEYDYNSLYREIYEEEELNEEKAIEKEAKRIVHNVIAEVYNQD